MTTRRHLFLDVDLVGAPTDAQGKPEGWTRVSSDGTLYVIIQGAYVAASGPGASSGGGGSGLLRGAAEPQANQGNEGDFYFQTTADGGVTLWGPKGPDDWGLSGFLLESRGALTQVVDQDYTLVAEGYGSGRVFELIGAGSKTVTVPQSTEFDDYSQPIWQLDNVGTGAVTITPASGVTLNGATNPLTMAPAYSSVVIRRRASGPANGYVVIGQYS